MVEPRIAAAVLFAGSLVPRLIFQEARQVTIPLLVLLQWDDENNDRQMALDLFDAFGTEEKTLHANMGGHTGVPRYEDDAGTEFFTRHLSQPQPRPGQQTAAAADQDGVPRPPSRARKIRLWPPTHARRARHSPRVERIEAAHGAQPNLGHDLTKQAPAVPGGHKVEFDLNRQNAGRGSINGAEARVA